MLWWCWTQRHFRQVFTVLSTSFGKTFFALFYSKWKYFVLIDHIRSEIIYLFCFCVLFSNIYSKKFMAIHWSDLCNFYSEVFFFFFFCSFCSFCLRKYFLLFFAEFKYLMFHNNIVKISETLNKRNLLKTCLQSYLPYPTNLCIICFKFYYGKSENIWFFKNPMTRIKLFCV